MNITTNETSRIFTMSDGHQISARDWIDNLRYDDDVLVVTDDPICNSKLLGGNNDIVVFHRAKVWRTTAGGIKLQGSNRMLCNAGGDRTSLIVPLDSMEYLTWNGRRGIVKNYMDAAADMRMYMQSMTDAQENRDTLIERQLILRDASFRLLETLAAETIVYG